MTCGIKHETDQITISGQLNSPLSQNETQTIDYSIKYTLKDNNSS